MRRLQTTRVAELAALLAATATRTPELRFMHRAHTVLLASIGPGCYAVARLFRESPRTVERWVRGFEADGAEALRDHPRGGRPRRLPPAVAAAVSRDLAAPPRRLGYASPRWSGALLSAHLAQVYGMRLGVRQCQRLLRSPRPAP
ncbi:MAG: helix-turn-helix domain containing protein [Burkholderiales bacterium]|nr:helix-turn-helix domain containing protein [Burkholderiales bacterium]